MCIRDSRLLIARTRSEATAAKILDVLGPRYKDRPGGYCRILKAGYRQGDDAPMAIIELVDRDVEAKGKDSGARPQPAAEAEPARAA
jgi:large subunit ribosomal protein L17